jgi:hypothetical protein
MSAMGHNPSKSTISKRSIAPISAIRDPELRNNCLVSFNAYEPVR